MAGYLLRNCCAGRKHFPLVLMLEPLEACNLSCPGCGRIREYAEDSGRRLSLQQCLAAVDECPAPVVSICGGEPLLYAEIGELVARIVARRRHVYLCTNALLLKKRLYEFRASTRLSINVHLDGMEATHDQAVGQQGVFLEAIAGIKAAKAAGFLVCTNTTVYRQTDMHEILVLFEYLAELGVDGMMLSPPYPYQATAQCDPDRAKQIFLTREEIYAKFRPVRRQLSRLKLITSPLYLEALCGLRQLSCAAWASPTRTVRGWKSPCYLVTDTHYETYEDLVGKTDWRKIGPGNDRRCDDCLVHCGFEPAAVLAANRRLRDAIRMALWQLT